jgi:hypothetical protein
VGLCLAGSGNASFKVKEGMGEGRGGGEGGLS